MLNPNQRLLYLAQLTPPEGYRLDSAIATTFSLDLLALLAAPVAMVMQDHRLSREAILGDPVSLLEAIRRTMGSVLVFCQQGRIVPPAASSPLFSYLEQTVIGVNSPHPKGVFHPKTWFLRFEANTEGDPPTHRFVCLTRNLTFDRSWDTILTLEGQLQTARVRGYSQNQPLKAFLEALPGMAPQKMAEASKLLMQRFVSEIQRVRFEAPKGFEASYRIIPLGIPGYKRFPRIENGKRNLVISPFISPEIVALLLPDSGDNILISRAEALDEFNPGTFSEIERLAKIYCLDSAAESPEDSEAAGDLDWVVPYDENPKGLHAKMLLLENSQRCRLFTGSANATAAAFSGRNVEMMVELNGNRKSIGVDALLGGEQEKHTLRSLLRPYQRSEEAGGDDSNVHKLLEDRLEEARRALARSQLKAVVRKADAGLYSFEIICMSQLKGLPYNVNAVCYPITISENQALSIDTLFNGQGIKFQDLPIECLTGFVAVRLSATADSEKAGLAFVLNLPVSGLPANRDSHVLASILSDRDRFMRYLMMILGEGMTFRPMGQFEAANGGAWKARDSDLMPLLEDMVRAYSRFPEKITRIKQMLAELDQAGVADKVVPADFRSVWSVFTQALNEER